MVWRLIEETRTPRGELLQLVGSATDYLIRVDGLQLMGSEGHYSEEQLADLVCARMAPRTAPNVLVGGLGMGFTLRAVLERVPDSARVWVVELVDEVINWSSRHFGHLAGHPLRDSRVQVHQGDVSAWLADAAVRFDAIVLDVDNGPGSSTYEAEASLYATAGLRRLHRSLAPAGVVGVWASDYDPEFGTRLQRAGFNARAHACPARPDREHPQHVLWVGQRRDSFSKA